jgi:hypothetical protein
MFTKYSRYTIINDWTVALVTLLINFLYVRSTCTARNRSNLHKASDAVSETVMLMKRSGRFKNQL